MHLLLFHLQMLNPCVSCDLTLFISVTVIILFSQ